MATPEGLCTRCSATGYCSEHDPAMNTPIGRWRMSSTGLEPHQAGEWVRFEAITELLCQRGEMLAVLRDLEWLGLNDGRGVTHRQCPACSALQSRGTGHNPYCGLAAAIAKAEDCAEFEAVSVKSDSMRHAFVDGPALVCLLGADSGGEMKFITRKIVVVDALSLYQTIGGLMKAARERAGLTQEAVGIQLGMTRANVANLESGKTAIMVTHIYNLAAMLEIPVSKLLPPLR